MWMNNEALHYLDVLFVKTNHIKVLNRTSLKTHPPSKGQKAILNTGSHPNLETTPPLATPKPETLFPYYQFYYSVS